MNSGAFLYTIAAGIGAGIALALLGVSDIAVPVLLFAVAVACVSFYPFHRKRNILLASAVACAVVVGMLRTDLFLIQQSKNDLTRFAGQNTSVQGTVTNDPERRETSLHANIAVGTINGIPAQGTLLVILPRDEQIAYGDAVEVSGPIETPQPFETDTGHMFDYAGYLQVQGVSAMISNAVLMRDMPRGFSVQGRLFNIKHSFERSLERLFPEPDNSLLEGVLLGERRGIPKDLNNEFVSSGLVHVVVLSGYNISVVSAGVFELLRFLPRTMSFAGGAFIMVLFALMTGAGATTVRALIMALIALLARYLGRSALALRSLAAAGAAMALWNPYAVLHDPSFILSMLATFGLITLEPWIELHLPRWLLKFPTVRGIVGSTIAVQIFVLPALLYFTGVLSFVSVPANALALPVVPPAMFFGFLAGVFGLAHPALGFVPALFSDAFLKWMLLVAHAASAVPLGAAVIPAFSAWIMAALYIPLTALAIWLHVRTAPLSRPN